jgi:hypothetical protein
VLEREMAPQEIGSSSGPGPQEKRRSTVDEHRIPVAGDPFYAAGAKLDHHHPCTCIDGWVFLGRIVESEHDLDGEVVEYDRVPCRRCAQRS